MSSRVLEPGMKSLPAMRMMRGKSGPTAARTAAMSCRGKRRRFSRLPPYSSVRRLVSGERNWQMR